MKRRKLNFDRCVLLCGLLLALGCFQAKAQSPATESASAQTVRVPARVTQAVDNANRVTLRGNVHRLARPEFDRGAISDAAQANRMVLLLKRSAEQEASLRTLLDQQQSKTSGSYHAWLTPEQFGKEFGPADEDVQAVRLWLQEQGFQVSAISAGRGFIEFTGTVGQVRNAFHTDIHRFEVNGQERFANVSDPQIPAALAPVVAGVTSLHNFPKKALLHKAGVFQREGKKGEVGPFFTGGSGTNQFFALGPADFAKIYNVPPALDGTGQTIAVVGDSNIDIKDARAFRTFFGLPANDPQVILAGPDPGIDAGTNGNGDEGEADLDVQWSGAIAPAATIKLVIAENPTTFGASGVDLAALYVVDNNLAPVMSESFGDCEPLATGTGFGSNAFYSNLWEQAAAQGITVTVSTGDSGSAACDGGGGSGSTPTSASSGLTVSGIASTQFNVAVGGTDFDDVGKQSTFFKPASGNDPVTLESALSYIPETPWNDTCAAAGSLTGCSTVNGNGIDLVAAGGGPSSVVAKPTWQTGAGVPADGKRDLPDVSLFASDGTKTDSFYFLCQADAVDTPSESCAAAGTVLFIGAGGTSASSPAFAAIMALINQQTGQRQGNANYVLYKLAAQANASCNSSAAGTITNTACIFYDTTKGNISVACSAGKPDCSNTGSSGTGVLVDPASKSTPAWITTAGYDRATGLGSVNVGNLATKWNTVSFNAATATITGSPSGPLAHGTATSFTVSVTGSGTPTGDVALIAHPVAGDVAVGVATLTAGSATITTNLLPGGTYPVTAHYSGSATFGGDESLPVTVTVGTESSKAFVSFITFDQSGNITSSSATTAAYGSPYILRVDVTNTSGTPCSAFSTVVPCPTGPVTLLDNNAPLNDFSGSNTAKLGGQGFLEDQPIQLAVGTHALVAEYQGDSSYAASTSTTDTVNITKATTNTAVTSSASSVAAGASVTLTATIGTSSSGVAPTGTVQFLNGSTPITGTVKYTPTNGSASAPAGLTATLTTTISALAPVQISDRRLLVPSGRLLLFACVMAVLLFLGRRVPGTRRRGYAYAALIVFAALGAGFSGCGGGSSSSGGSSTPTGKSVTINATYSGDANYSTSSGNVIIAVQ